MAQRTFAIDITGKAKGAVAAFAATRVAAAKTDTFVGRKMASMSAKSKLAMGAIGGGAILAGLGLVHVRKQFREAENTIRVATGKTGEDLAELRESFKRTVAQVPADFNDAAEVIAGLSRRLQISGEPLEDLSAQFLELSRITDTDLKDSIRRSTRLFKDWNLEVDEMGPALDMLFRAGQVSGIDVGTLAQQMVDFGAPLRALGFDFDTAMALFAGFESSGIAVEKMMPGLRIGLRNLAGGGTKPVNDTFKELGVNMEDPIEGLKDLFRAIEDADELDGLRIAMQVFGQRAGADMAVAIQEGKFAFDDLQDSIVNGSDTIRQAGQDTMMFSDRWQLFKNRVLVRLEPLARRFFDVMEKGLEFMSRPQVIRALTMLGAALGGLIALKVIVGPIIAIGKVLFAVGNIVLQFVGFVMRMVNPVAIILVTLGYLFFRFRDQIFNALSSARDIAIGVFERIRDAMVTAAGWVQDRAKDIAEFFVGAFHTIRDTATTVWDTIVLIVRGGIDGVKKAIEVIQEVVGFVRRVISRMIEIFQNIVSVIVDVAQAIHRRWRSIVMIIGGPIGMMALIVEKAMDTIVAVVRTAIDVVAVVFRTVRSIVVPVVRTAFGIIVGAVSTAMNVISEVIQFGIRVVRATFNTVRRIVVPVVRTAFGIIVDVVKLHIDAIMAVIRLGMRVMRTVFRTIRSIVVPVVRVAFSIISGIVERVMGVIQRTIRIGIRVVRRIFRTISDIVDMARDAFSGVLRIGRRHAGPGGTIPRLIRGAIRLVRRIWSVIDTILIDPIGAASDAIRRIFRFLRDRMASIARRIREMMSSIWNTIRDRVIAPMERLRDRVIEIFQRVRDRAREIFERLRDGLISLFRSARDRVIEIAERIRTRVGDTIQEMRRTVIDRVRALRDGILNIFRALRDSIGDVFGAIRRVAENVWERIVSTVSRLINRLISPINTFLGGLETVLKVIPGLGSISVPRIPLLELAAGGVGPFVDPHKTGPFATAIPRAIVGEGSNIYPEYVIPTDPKYRDRARGLTAGLMTELGGMGVPGMFLGGVVKPFKAGASWVKDKASGLIRGLAKAAYEPVDSALKTALDALPNVMHMRDVAHGARKVVKRWVAGADSAGQEFIGGTGPGPTRGPGTSGTEQWRGVALQALSIAGQSSAWIGDLLTQMGRESGGNPNAINRYDINWQRGHPSVGLMQVIGPTYQAYKHPSYDNPPYWYGASLNPLSNILASVRYTVSRYGDLGAWGRRGFAGYSSGGLVGQSGGYVHPGEMVLTKADQMGLLNMIRGGDASVQVTLEHGAIQINVHDGDGKKAGRDAAKGFMDTLAKRSIKTDARIS